MLLHKGFDIITFPFFKKNRFRSLFGILVPFPGAGPPRNAGNQDYIFRILVGAKIQPAIVIT
jgi:hypothetical protein